jgi:acyl-CoA reductase-like NAD-dependent aldehyde dehydrogenase
MSDARIRSTSPQQPDDVVLDTAATSPNQVAVAAHAARTAQDDWRRASPAERGAALAAAADAIAGRASELAELISREVGKPIVEARGEVARSVAILRYYAQSTYLPSGEFHGLPGAAFSFTDRRPRGVVGLITPWNFPVAIPIWKAAPALAYGNAVLWKPSPDSTGCATLLAEVITAVLPRGLLQVLPGGVETGQAVLDITDAVSFTGSAAVGRTVVTSMAAQGKPVQAEMGGLNASVVLADADVEFAAADIAAAAMSFAGQKCTATSRVIVVGDAATFTEALVASVAALHVGDPADPSVTVGPVISQSAQHRVRAAASSSGGKVLTGRSVAGREGWFASPTLVAEPAEGSVLAVEEVFGPITTINAVATPDEAVARVNATRYGLVTSVYGTSLYDVLRVVGEVDTGLVKANQPTTGVDFWLPFGGEKESSYGGREQGTAARDFYTSTRTVSIRAQR